MQKQEFVEKGATVAVAGASLREPVAWHDIDWKKAHRNVRRLQARIVKAKKEGKKRKVRALQFILTRSQSARALATKRVTTNRGKRTPGVDGEVWNTPHQKAQAVAELRTKGYRPQPLRRKAIPKKNGGNRFLGIPTMKDRAMQALYALALDPIAETGADPNSYGFRRERSPADAIERCFGVLARRTSAQWVLEGDIQACFDELGHEWLLTHIPLPKSLLRGWLRAGYVEQGQWHATKSGTPQGGIISPILANMALDGLETELIQRFGPTQRKRSQNKVHLVRFADDFIVTGTTAELLENEVRPVVETFLTLREAKLSVTKTHITHIDTGFDFLGQNLRKYGQKLLIRPSDGSMKALLTKIQAILKANPQTQAGPLIIQLNAVIRGWSNYHCHVVSKATFNKMDWHIHRMVRRWARKKHRRKSWRWIKQKYFKTVGTRNWVFGGKVRNGDGTMRQVYMYSAAQTPIMRHRKIKGAANPYDPEWEHYFEKRLRWKTRESLRGKRQTLQLWLEQQGQCPICGEMLTEMDEWDTHHIRPRVEGGEDKLDNLVLLHLNCHRQVHSQRLVVSKPRPVKRALVAA
ncbi:group II intron reverse transcriptase/maturase [Neptuniibacter sp.]|uniref:group II intron reverse transcriptase/maturase n=1 Tax=Neptuniibacter sp. TaxID=1962643 RepID=UPI002635DAD9|nr:group II intron reverse transcriptase/maturase [Neptuniibacter sp.]MCP4598422.1 group II intron reverse transcriptase/maturase [Neptuniibacter sp.]